MSIPVLVSLTIAFNVLGNILIKKGAGHPVRIFANPFALTGYFFFVIVVLMIIKLTGMIGLTSIAFLFAVNMLMTFLAGIFVFKEKCSALGYLGILLVVIGLINFRL